MIGNNKAWLGASAIKEIPFNVKSRRYSTRVVGTSTAGWTEADCDYLCDGTNDASVINAAISALPNSNGAYGGEVLILNGTYNINSIINVNKWYVTIRGVGIGTVLKRMFNTTTSGDATKTPVISLSYGRGKVYDLKIDGNKSAYAGSSLYKNCGIYMSGDTNIVDNVYITNTGSYAIYISQGGIVSNCDMENCGGITVNGGFYEDCLIIGNRITGCTDTAILCSNARVIGNTIEVKTINDTYKPAGILINGTMAIVSGNIVNMATSTACSGIQLDVSSGGYITTKSAVIGNIISLKNTSTQNSIYVAAKCTYNLIANNIIYGKNYVNSGGSTNTFVNNKYS